MEEGVCYLCGVELDDDTGHETDGSAEFCTDCWFNGGWDGDDCDERLAMLDEV